MADTSAYLFVVQAGSAASFPLSDAGDYLIGRAEDAWVRLDDHACSRRHAILTVGGDGVRLSDLGSHNGTRVNGALIHDTRPLVSGDVIAIGQTTMVLHCAAPPPEPRALLGGAALHHRLEQEVARAVRYERPLTLVWLTLGDPAADAPAAAAALERELRLIDVVGRAGDDALLALLPELDPVAAQDAARRLVAALRSVAPAARAGVASCPADGCRADALFAASRAAAAPNAGTGVTLARECVTRLALGPHTICVADAAMVQLFELLRRLAASRLTVLVFGETGAGKESAAQALHYWSGRADKPLVSINCATLPDTLIESELFGHEKGAFSGAVATKIGRLEAAHGGTVFLDEVGELSPAAQAKLLRVLETRRLSRLGGLKEHEVDIRLVAATNRNLEEEVAAGRFRQDLFFRLGSARVTLPPLRARPRDLSLLTRVFLDEACATAERAPLELSAAAMEALGRYGWPGNLRELKNEMSYLAATMNEAQVEPWHLPERMLALPPAPAAATTVPVAAAAPAPRMRPVADELRELERRRMEQALEATGGVQAQAAALIGMPVRTFSMKLKQYSLGDRFAR